MASVRAVDIPGKWGGATGTLAAYGVAYPELDWMAIAKDFVGSVGFTWAPLTTQVEPHERRAHDRSGNPRTGRFDLREFDR